MCTRGLLHFRSLESLWRNLVARQGGLRKSLLQVQEDFTRSATNLTDTLAWYFVLLDHSFDVGGLPRRVFLMPGRVLLCVGIGFVHFLHIHLLSAVRPSRSHQSTDSQRSVSVSSGNCLGRWFGARSFEHLDPPWLIRAGRSGELSRAASSPGAHKGYFYRSASVSSPMRPRPMARAARL